MTRIDSDMTRIDSDMTRIDSDMTETDRPPGAGVQRGGGKEREEGRGRSRQHRMPEPGKPGQVPAIRDSDKTIRDSDKTIRD